MGAGFGQAFAGPFMAGLELGNRRRALKVQEDEAKLRGRLIDMQMKRLERGEATAKDLKELYSQQEAVPGTGAPAIEQPIPFHPDRPERGGAAPQAFYTPLQAQMLATGAPIRAGDPFPPVPFPAAPAGAPFPMPSETGLPEGIAAQAQITPPVPPTMQRRMPSGDEVLRVLMGGGPEHQALAIEMLKERAAMAAQERNDAAIRDYLAGRRPGGAGAGAGAGGAAGDAGNFVELPTVTMGRQGLSLSLRTEQQQESMRRAGETATFLGFPPGHPRRDWAISGVLYGSTLDNADQAALYRMLRQQAGAPPAAGPAPTTAPGPSPVVPPGDREGIAVPVPKSVDEAWQRYLQSQAPTTAPQAQVQAGGDIIGQAMDAADARRIKRAKEEAEATAAARRKEEPIPDTTQQAFRAYSNILTATDELRTFTPEEIKMYAGILNMPMREGLQMLRSLAPGTFGDPDKRFAQFKTLMGRFQETAFGDAGKQLTGIELGVVRQYTPTGREPGGVTELQAKIASLERFTRMARELRLKLSKEGRGQIDMEALDRLLIQSLGPGNVPQAPTGAGAPSGFHR